MRALILFVALVVATELQPSPALALVGARVYPSPDAPPMDDAVVVVEEGRVTLVSPRKVAKIPAGATTTDCSGLVVTAGFQNSHVHFTDPRWAAAAEQPAAQLTERLEEMLTRYG